MMTAEEKLGLDVARYLIECGVPVFVAKPAKHGDQWLPTGGTGSCGYWLPTGWQQTQPDASVLDRWRPGMALAAVMGHVVDGADVDPRNGGTATLAGLRSAGMWPQSYGRAETPSGGSHDLIAALGVGSRDNVSPGLDVKGGRADGEGRGFLFIAPTLKRSKVDGEVRAYRWKVKPNLDGLVVDGLADETGEALAELIRPSRDAPSTEPFTVPAEVRTNPHQGSIPAGQRDASLRDYVWLMANKGHDQRELEALVRARWEDCEQPAGKPYPLEQALAMIPRALTKAEPLNREVKPGGADDGHRTVSFVRASSIKVRPVHWLWQGRIALGTLALLAGREGIGKSTIGYDLAAQVTRGDLPGRYQGEPRQVVVAATEDSWEHTIVPRLMGAGADLDKVLRVDVTTAEGVDTSLSLPRDIDGLERLIRDERVALVLLDPLMSRLASTLDSHKDAEVRLALEPLTKIADRTGSAFVGLIHVNKSGSTDPLNGIMGSRAFAAVARSVLYAMVDPEDETLRHLGVPKNNLGTTDLPTLDYRIESAKVADTDEGPVWTGRVSWVGETSQSIRELMASADETADARSAVGEATTWLKDYLAGIGAGARVSEVKAAAKVAGVSASALNRAKTRLKVKSSNVPGVFPRQNTWELPDDPKALRAVPDL